MPTRRARAIRSHRFRTSSDAGRKSASKFLVGSSAPTIRRRGTTSRRAGPPSGTVTAASVEGRLPFLRRTTQRPSRASACRRRARRKSACASRKGIPVSRLVSKSHMSFSNAPAARTSRHQRCPAASPPGGSQPGYPDWHHRSGPPAFVRPMTLLPATSLGAAPGMARSAINQPRTADRRRSCADASMGRGAGVGSPPPGGQSPRRRA